MRRNDRTKRGAGGVRGGFTLVEMLVVVVIIGILAGLVTAVAMRVRVSARVAEIKLELSGIEQAMALFKEKYGDYPPDCTNEQEVARFIAATWPRYTGDWKTAIGWANLQNDSAAALVFWLGGMRNGTELLGFSPNPRKPFETDTTEGRQPLFDFRPDRLRLVGNKLYYYQPNATNETEPYVYFKAGANGYFVAGTSTVKQWNNCKACRDLRVGPNAWAAPNKFQLRAPGLDGKHGSGVAFPNGTDYNEFQYDDVANFSDGTFEDAIP